MALVFVRACVRALTRCKIKVKLSLYFFFLSEHHAMKAYWENRDTAPCIFDPGTRRR